MLILLDFHIFLYYFTKAASDPDDVHVGAAEGVGAGVPGDALPGHLHQGGDRHEDRPHRGQGSGQFRVLFIYAQRPSFTFRLLYFALKSCVRCTFSQLIILFEILWTFDDTLSRKIHQHFSQICPPMADTTYIKRTGSVHVEWILNSFLPACLHSEETFQSCQSKKSPRIITFLSKP